MTADQTPSYDARSALDDVATSREAVTDRLVTPWWYHPVLGAIVAVVILVNTLPIPPVLGAVLALACVAGVGVLVAAYKKATGLWVNPRNAGPRARPWWAASALVITVTIVLAIIPTLSDLTYPAWVGALLAAVAFVAVVVLGPRVDAGLREDIRSGDAPLPDRA